MKRLKIIQALVFYLPVRIGGIEVYVAALAKGLKAAGHQVKILVPTYPGEQSYPAEMDGIEIITYTEFKNTSRAEFSGSVMGKGLAAFTTILQNEQPDIVHFHQLTSSNGISLFHLKAAKELGAKVAFTAHLAVFQNKKQTKGKPVFSLPAKATTSATTAFTNGNKTVATASARPLHFFKGWMQRRRNGRNMQTVFQLSDAVFILSDWYADVLKQHDLFSTKISVIKQGLVATEYSLQQKRSGSELKLVYAGRIFPDKGLHVLLQAIKSLSVADVSLSIYGQIDGDAYADYCKTICGTAPNIRWHLPIGSAEVITTLSAYDCLVLPTIVTEMAPLIIQDAFAARLPVIGTNSGGIKEEITDGVNGFLFNTGDAAALQQCIQKIISNRNLLTAFTTQLPAPRPFTTVVDAVESKYRALTNA